MYGKLMGDRSEILDALSKWSTSTILAVALVVMVWMNASNTAKWNERIAGIMERQAESQERQEEATKTLSDALVDLLEDRK